MLLKKDMAKWGKEKKVENKIDIMKIEKEIDDLTSLMDDDFFSSLRKENLISKDSHPAYLVDYIRFVATNP